MLLSLVHAVEPRNAEASINVAWNLSSVEITATESAKFRDAEGNDIQSLIVEPEDSSMIASASAFVAINIRSLDIINVSLEANGPFSLVSAASPAETGKEILGWKCIVGEPASNERVEIAVGEDDIDGKTDIIYSHLPANGIESDELYPLQIETESILDLRPGEYSATLRLIMETE